MAAGYERVGGLEQVDVLVLGERLGQIEGGACRCNCSIMASQQGLPDLLTLKLERIYCAQVPGRVTFMARRRVDEEKVCRRMSAAQCKPCVTRVYSSGSRNVARRSHSMRSVKVFEQP